MKRNYFKSMFLPLICLFVCLNSYGQNVKDTIVSTAAYRGATVASNAVDNGFQAGLDKLSNILRKKAKDTVFVIIPDITFSDPNLSRLKAAFIKNKVEISSMMKEGAVILKITGKKKANAGLLYDALDESLKKTFEPQEMDDTQMVLQYNKSNH